MDNALNIRIDLDVAAVQIKNLFQLRNVEIQAQVDKGINAAIDLLSKDNTISDMVSLAVQRDVNQWITGSVLSQDFKHSLMKKVHEKVQEKVTAYADELAETILAGLKKE